MSNDVYNSMWREAQVTVRKLMREDARVARRPREPDKRAALEWILRLYADYIQITRTLDECYDQLLQPQKRILIKKLLDGCIGRLLELKHELMTELDKSNFHYFDNIMIERRLTHEDLEVPSPRFYYREKEIELQQRKEFIQEILDKAKGKISDSISVKIEAEAPPKRPGTALWDKTPAAPVETPEQKALKEAVKLIQIHERSRQKRLRSYNYRIMALRKYERKKDKAHDTEKEENAAIVIQKWLRGYRDRKRMKKLREFEDTVMGMIQRKSIDYSYKDRIAEVQAIRRALRRELQAAFEAAIIKERDFVDRLLSPVIFEDVGDELREWIRAWYYDVTKLPAFPKEAEVKLKDTLLGLPKGTPHDMFPKIEPTLPGVAPIKLGGSQLITAEYWATSTHYKLAAEKLKKKKGKKEKKPKLTKEEKKELKEKQKAAKKAQKERIRLEKIRGFQLDESKVNPALIVAEREYRAEWEVKRPDAENPSEKHFVDLIRTEEVHVKEAEVRRAVDELMRYELELLLDAEWREKHKHKKKKRKGRKRKKKERGRKRKRKGKKKKKDPTGNRTTEELLEELVRAGIVKNSGEARMEDFYGEPSYCNYELRERFNDPLPTLGDIRQVVREYCILPLGSERVHELAPLTKSVLLAGPPQCGKSMLVDIICNETGALRMDLSPEALHGQYPGKKGMAMLLHLVNKVARLLQPAVIFIDNAHRNFYKKVPKDEKYLEPRRIAKTLKKMAKGIKGKDQLLILGTSNEPWKAKGKKLIKAYQRHIFIPPMDYGSRSFMWNKLIMACNGVDRNFEVTPLAHLTQWVTLPMMKEVVTNTLSVERRIQLSYNPLQHREILDRVLQHPPVPPLKDRPKWLKWYNKLPIQKQRQKVLAEWKKEAERQQRKKR